MKVWLLARRRLGLLLSLDAALFACAWVGAYFVRFDLVAAPWLWWSLVDRTLLAVVLAKAIVFVVRRAPTAR